MKLNAMISLMGLSLLVLPFLFDLSAQQKEPDSFRGIPWFAKKTSVDGLVFVRHDVDDDMDVYTRKGETLAIGDVKVLTVEYWFSEGEFYRVHVLAKGREKYLALQKQIESQHGKGECGELPPGWGLPSESCMWYGEHNVELDYHKESFKVELWYIGLGSGVRR